LSAHFLSLLYSPPIRPARLELRPMVTAGTAPTNLRSNALRLVGCRIAQCGELLYSTAFTGTLHDFALSRGNVKAAA